MVMLQAFNGAGDIWMLTFVNFISFWLLEIPSAYFRSKLLFVGAQHAAPHLGKI